jgi:3-oxoacyl-[acyl-carrier-protein] synthase III|tara:strand:+ start:267 stop:470 length:204 start_codon:yes stop_codon:yes gene_type:complete
MSNEYKEANDERLMESVYEIVDSLTEPAARRLLEDMLFTQGIDSEAFEWTMIHQTKQFIEQAEKVVA